jgi:hypothetical protein
VFQVGFRVSELLDPDLELRGLGMLEHLEAQVSEALVSHFRNVDAH